MVKLRDKIPMLEDRLFGFGCHYLQIGVAFCENICPANFRNAACEALHYRKVRYRGLAKNTAQLHTLFALANLIPAGRNFALRAYHSNRRCRRGGPPVTRRNCRVK
jgi:hypothetical protein